MQTSRWIFKKGEDDDEGHQEYKEVWEYGEEADAAKDEEGDKDKDDDNEDHG